MAAAVRIVPPPFWCGVQYIAGFIRIELSGNYHAPGANRRGKTLSSASGVTSLHHERNSCSFDLCQLAFRIDGFADGVVIAL